MANCEKCGQELPHGAKFCFNCGKPVQIVPNAHAKPPEREITYEGEVHKCPNCGEVLAAFTPICPTCGYELRGAKASDSIREFTSKLEKAETDAQRIILLRNFPIPNTKEDIFEFMILASSNLCGTGTYGAENSVQQGEFDAWLTKFEQSFQKAKLMFKDSPIFPEFQNLYKQTHKKIGKEKMIKGAKNTGFKIINSAALPNAIISLGWIISLFILIVMCMGSTDAPPLLLADFIAGAYMLPHVLKCSSSLPALITAIGLVATIVVLALLGKTSDDFQVLLLSDIIATAALFIRTFKRGDT